jgi:hypothetical protein
MVSQDMCISFLPNLPKHQHGKRDHGLLRLVILMNGLNPPFFDEAWCPNCLVSWFSVIKAKSILQCGPNLNRELAFVEERDRFLHLVTILPSPSL